MIFEKQDNQMDFMGYLLKEFEKQYHPAPLVVHNFIEACREILTNNPPVQVNYRYENVLAVTLQDNRSFPFNQSKEIEDMQPSHAIPVVGAEYSNIIR
jgi:hypothetical protein